MGIYYIILCPYNRNPGLLEADPGQSTVLGGAPLRRSPALRPKTLDVPEPKSTRPEERYWAAVKELKVGFGFRV